MYVTHVIPRSSYKIEHASSPNDDDSDENDVQVFIVLEESYYTQLKSEKGMNRLLNPMIMKMTMNHRLNEMKPVWMIWLSTAKLNHMDHVGELVNFLMN